MLMRILLLLVSLAGAGMAQSDFRYYVKTQFNSEKLSYEESYDLGISRSGGKFRLSGKTIITPRGCAQDSFTYTNDEFGIDLPPGRAEWLFAQVRAMSLRKLSRKMTPADLSKASWGWIDLDGKSFAYDVRAPRDQPELLRLRALLDAFEKEAGAKAEHDRKRSTIEGDPRPARAVSIGTLLRNPRRYDGKRVRVSGYDRVGFEESNFGPSPDAPFDKSLWLGGLSSFADQKRIGAEIATARSSTGGRQPADWGFTIDGVFRAGPAGHMGVWPGELILQTRVVPGPLAAPQAGHTN
jgi:hypothetical protein